jgi:dimethylamine monooxygenase subunit C
MLITGIKSRPVYDQLTPFEDGLVHLVVGQGSGGSAMLRLLSALPKGANFQVLYSTESFTGQNQTDALQKNTGTSLTIVPSNGDALNELDVRLSKALMGTRLYLAGSESFIGAAMKIAGRYDLNRDEVLREHCGSLVRRVWCVHCDTFIENVTHRVLECPGCSKALVVRDHYSQLMAAFMGVQGDAEVAGELPEATLLDT